MAAFGSRVADEEAGDVAFDEALVEVGEQVAETLVGPAAVAREQTDKGVEDDETGIDAFDSVEEAGEILRERERTIAASL